MTTTPTNKPITTIREGRLKAVVWKNENQNGPFYSVQLIRTYRDADGNFHDSDSFVGAELLRIARLAQNAFDATVELRRQDNSDNGDAQ